VQVPASAGHLLEYRLGQAGLDAAGFAVAVPHYLADTAYAPRRRAAGEPGRPHRPVVRHRPARGGGRGVREQVDAQVASSEEVLAVVTALEGQYDAYRAGASRSLLAEMGGGLPTADELGDEFERFLADQADGSQLVALASSAAPAPRALLASALARTGLVDLDAAEAAEGRT
jgi:hypothetical protein